MSLTLCPAMLKWEPVADGHNDEQFEKIKKKK